MQGDRAAVHWSLLVLRLVVGLIFMAHGAQKLFGAFGGPGMEGLLGMLGPVAWLVAIGEFFGGAGLVVGFLARFSAAANMLTMFGAIWMVHGKNGFFASSGGFEFNLALLGLLFPILVAGPGAFSVGRFLPLPKASDGQRPLKVLE